MTKADANFTQLESRKSVKKLYKDETQDVMYNKDAEKKTRDVQLKWPGPSHRGLLATASNGRACQPTASANFHPPGLVNFGAAAQLIHHDLVPKILISRPLDRLAIDVSPSKPRSLRICFPFLRTSSSFPRIFSSCSGIWRTRAHCTSKANKLGRTV